MKTNIRILSVLSVALMVGAPSVSLATIHASSPAGAVSVSRIGPDVEFGVPRVAVWRSLGSPSRVLPDGSWLYTGFRAREGGAALDDCGTLLVRFKQDRVSEISLLAQSAVASLAPRAGRTDALARADASAR